MAYTTPSSFPAGLPFQPPSSPYTVPTSQPISLQFGDDVVPSGISGVTASDQSSYGTPMVAFRIRSVLPSGIASTIAYGTPTLYNTRQYVDLDTYGFTYESFGDLSADLRNKYIYPTVIQQSGEFGDFTANVAPQELPFDPPATYTEPTVFPAELPFLTGALGTLFLTGIDPGDVGDAAVYLQTRYIAPTGLAPGDVGTASAYLRNQFILPGGIAPNPQTGPGASQEAPPPTVYLRTRYTYPAGIAPPTMQFGTQYVAFYYQFIDQGGYSIQSASYGAPLVAYRIRYVYPAFITSNIFGSTVVVRTLYVSPSGFGGEQIPTNHELEDFSNKVRTHSGAADPAAYGIATIRNAFEYIRPNSSTGPSSIVNFPLAVYNQDNYLYVRQYMNTDAETAKYGAALVENRNRTLGAFGHQDSRFSFYAANVYNKAVAIVPAGLDATLWGNTLIAYRHRNVTPEGFDAFFSAYHIVYNDARVIVSSGIATGDVGTPASVVNRNRTVTQFFPYGGESVGAAFVAYRIRSVFPSSPYDVAWPLPEVRLNPYPIKPTGIDSYATGGHYLDIHFNIIAPYAVNIPSVVRIGEPFIQNRNKNVYPYGYDFVELGRPRVELYNRTVGGAVGGSLVFGPVTISYRTKTLAVSPFSSHSVSTFNQVRNLIPDPPSQQYILEPLAPSITGQVGNPTVRHQTIFPNGINTFRIGTLSIRANAIFYRWEFDDAQVGTPRIVGPQYVLARQIPQSSMEGDSDTFVSKPQLSPYTIYAPSSDQATTQARVNHPPNTPTVIDNDLWNSPPYHFGNHAVSNYYRAVFPTWGFFASSAVGEPTLSLRNRRVYPNTFRPFRAGVPIMNNSQVIVAESIDEPLVETPRIAFVIEASPIIAPEGLDSLVVGNHDITLYNRQVYPVGVDTSLFGNQLVGYPRRYYLDGYAATLWGNTVVSHYTRYVFPLGFDASIMFDTLEGFNSRMRVTRRNPPAQMQGFGGAKFGDHLVSTRNRYLLPIGSVSSVVGAYTTIAGAAYISPTGIDSFIVGDIDRWESGKIKAHGDDLASYGTPRINRTIAPSAIVSGLVGTPTQARRIEPAGFPPVGFEGPSVTDPYGCSSRVVTVFPILPGAVNANSTVSAA